MTYLMLQSWAPRWHPTLRWSGNTMEIEELMKTEEFSFSRFLTRNPSLFGVRFPEAVFPTTAIDIKGFKQFGDFLGVSFWPVVSKKFREAIEHLEPGHHQFVEINLLYKSGKKSDEEYFIFNTIDNLDDTIDIKSSKISESSSLPGRANSGARGGDLAIIKRNVYGRHIWQAIDYYKQFFISDELFVSFKEKKIKSLEFHEQIDV